MLTSINPLGERARGTRFGRTLAWYLAGSAAGGLTLGVIAGLCGEALHALLGPGPAALGVSVAVACVVGVAAELGVAGINLPTVRRQVNEYWLARYRGWVYGVGFGFQLGLGVVTVVTSAAVYVMVVVAVLVGSWAGAAAIGLTFGIARALPMLLVVHVHDARQLRSTLQRVHDRAPAARWMARAGVVTLAAVAAVMTLGGTG